MISDKKLLLSIIMSPLQLQNIFVPVILLVLAAVASLIFTVLSITMAHENNLWGILLPGVIVVLAVLFRKELPPQVLAILALMALSAVVLLANDNFKTSDVQAVWGSVLPSVIVVMWVLTYTTMESRGYDGGLPVGAMVWGAFAIFDRAIAEPGTPFMLISQWDMESLLLVSSLAGLLLLWSLVLRATTLVEFGEEIFIGRMINEKFYPWEALLQSELRQLSSNADMGTAPDYRLNVHFNDGRSFKWALCDAEAQQFRSLLASAGMTHGGDTPGSIEAITRVRQGSEIEATNLYFTAGWVLVTAYCYSTWGLLGAALGFLLSSLPLWAMFAFIFMRIVPDLKSKLSINSL